MKDFEIHFRSSGALCGFGFAEMSPVIYSGKGEAKRRLLTSGVVNNLKMIDLLSQGGFGSLCIDTVLLLGKRVEFCQIENGCSDCLF